jgi:hypothetical protein
VGVWDTVGALLGTLLGAKQGALLILGVQLGAVLGLEPLGIALGDILGVTPGIVVGSELGETLSPVPGVALELMVGTLAGAAVEGKLGALVGKIILLLPVSPVTRSSQVISALLPASDWTKSWVNLNSWRNCPPYFCQ